MKILFLLSALLLQPLAALAEDCKIEQVDHKCLLRVWPMRGGADLLRREWEIKVPIFSGECAERPYHFEKVTVPGTDMSAELFISAERYRMEFFGAGDSMIASAEFPWTRESRVSDLSGSHKAKFFTLMCGTSPWPW